jgi:hypothetical protein
VPTAEADGHTHILVLLTRPLHARRSLSLIDRLLVVPRLHRLSPELAEKFAGRGEPYHALLQHIDAGAGPLGRATVVGIRPVGPEISNLERRRDRLQDGAERGFRAVMETFAAIGTSDVTPAANGTSASVENGRAAVSAGGTRRRGGR